MILRNEFLEREILPCFTSQIPYRDNDFGEPNFKKHWFTTY